MSERQHSELCDCDECEAHDAHERAIPDDIQEIETGQGFCVLPVNDREHLTETLLAEADAQADFDAEEIEMYDPDLFVN